MSLAYKYYPWARKLAPKVAVGLATLGITGSLKAPGTFGSLLGLFFYLLFFRFLPLEAYLLFAGLIVYFAVGVCDQAEKVLKRRDPGCIVLDEFAAMQLCFLPFPFLNASNTSIWTGFLGFALFRIFDIYKPLGIKKIQNLEGGLGCVADDVAAALVVWVILNIIIVVQ